MKWVKAFTKAKEVALADVAQWVGEPSPRVRGCCFIPS